jgi:hypothetical protein
MGAPTSDVGYTSATTRRRDHEIYKDMWWGWRKKFLILKKTYIEIIFF